MNQELLKTKLQLRLSELKEEFEFSKKCIAHWAKEVDRIVEWYKNVPKQSCKKEEEEEGVAAGCAGQEQEEKEPLKLVGPVTTLLGKSNLEKERLDKIKKEIKDVIEKLTILEEHESRRKS